MSLRSCLGALLGAAVLLASPAPAQRALLLRDRQPAAVPAGHGVQAALARVVAGPDAAERAAGFTTAIPPGTALLGVRREGDRLAIELSHPFAALCSRAAELDLAVEQLAKTTFDVDPSLRAVDLHVVDELGALRPLPELLFAAGLGPDPARTFAPRSPRGAGTGAGPDHPVQGALSGLTIAVSPGHGYYWHSTLGWTTQRPLIDGLIEDVHNNEIALRYLIPYLENMGARVVNCRERAEIPHDRVADNDQGPPTYAETGAWTTSTSAGYQGGTYRYVATNPAGGTSAAWQVALPADGSYPVYAWYRAGTNRARDARYEIRHAGGVDVVTIDQTRDDSTWTWLGEWWFTAAAGARITLTNESNDPGRVVIADAVRVGAGFGSIARGGATSGRLRWLEASRYWAQFSGAPASVWDSVSGGQDNDDDVTCRPRFAEWRGADAYIALHTNAGGGSGTDTYIYSGGATPGSTTLQSRVQTQIVGDIRQYYDSTWIDRGTPQANFGELRLLSTMPGVLVELAFHDVAGSRDHRALHDPVFRRIAGRAYARGVLRYFAPTAPFAPEPPTALRVTQDGAGGLAVAWLGSAGATGYTIEQSSDGKSFAAVGSTATTAWSTGPLPAGSLLSFRVRSFNATGRSFPTEVLTAGTSHRGTAELLLVQGFDRLDRYVKAPDNTFDYLHRHGQAIRDAGEFSLGFDAATNDAVRINLVRLTDYRAVDWACGEESTADDTFDGLEQVLVQNYLAQGGRLLVSGAELGWDLDARGSAGDRAFYNGVLGARYVADDAGTYGFRSVAGGLFDGLPAGTFDDGTRGTYDVDYPDVIAPFDAGSRLCLEYSTGSGQGAALERQAGAARVVNLGFPLETVTSASLRASLMARALRFLLEPRALQAPADVRLGTIAPLAVDVPAYAGRTYLLAASLGTSPGTLLPGGQLLPLNADGLFSVSLDPASPVFLGFLGALDAQGRASAGFFAPPIPLLLGQRFYFSGLVLAQHTPPVVGTVLPWVALRVR
ncbi:MAG: N-acetylmuramoyl-L-alanine amidase [Planctomycetes bacterium]|nr:N-acetylmuramoyl-L-alanine amidase [Planctomycetota bacterium]